MKLRKLFLVTAFALPVFGALATKAYHKKVPMVWHIEKIPSEPCIEGPLPIPCIGSGTTICMLEQGPYYFQSNCTQPVLYTP